ncbi:MAG: VCBS repeat-containing protein [Terriglobales bacterium]|jgi:hypothetical protein
MKTKVFSGTSLVLVVLASIQTLFGQSLAPEKQASFRPFQQVSQPSWNGNARLRNHARSSGRRIHANPYASAPPSPAVAFLSATRIESDGTAAYPLASGDFNGDKLTDVATLIGNSGSPSGVYLAVLLNVGGQLSNSPILTPVSFATGDFILAGDVNKDGKDDIVLVHRNSMDVLLSNGDGTFAAPQNIATSISDPVAAALWDVNHDQKLDVLVVDGNSNQAAFLIGNGQGNFAPPQLTAFPGQASVGILADIDRDGNLDFVTNSTLYPGDGAGGFLPGISFQSNDGQNAGAVGSDSVAVGDINGDGLLDVVTANGYWNTVSVFLNHGGRSLVQDGVSFWSGNEPVALAFADVNWDGHADLIVTNAAESDFSVFMGKGDGTFDTPTAEFAIGGSPSTKAVLADFNGDGDLDAAFADNQSSVVLAMGFGDGTFQAAPTSNIVVAPGTNSSGTALSIASADFNGDSWPDFVVGQSSTSPGLGVLVFLTQKDGSLGKGVTYAAGDALSYVAVGDINKDGKADIVASNWATGAVEVLRGNGDGTFQAPVSIALPGIANGIVIADFNGDGWPDVALAGKDPVVYILLNDGTGSLRLAGTYPISGVGYELVATDLNNAGTPDLCIAMTSTSRVAVLLGNGDGTFSAAPDFDTTLPSIYGIASADVDGDGYRDLVVTSPDAGAIAFAYGNGDGTFIVPSTYVATALPTQLNPAPGEVALTDMNGDGNLDIVYANAGFSSVGVFLGDGTGNFYGPSEFPAGGGSVAVAIADVNKDGWPDVVTADANFSGVSVLYNTTGSQPASDFSITANPQAMQVAPGGTATATFSLTPSGDFIGSVQLQCQNLPATLSCGFTPSILHLTKGAKSSSQLTITAAQSNAAATSSGPAFWALAMIPVLGGLFFWRTPRVLGTTALFSLLASLMLLSGCGSGTSSKLPPQTYTITVAATAWNGTAHSVQMQVTVQ